MAFAQGILGQPQAPQVFPPFHAWLSLFTHTAEQKEGLVAVAALASAADALQVGVGGGRLSLIVVIPLAVGGLLEAARPCSCLLTNTIPALSNSNDKQVTGVPANCFCQVPPRHV